MGVLKSFLNKGRINSATVDIELHPDNWVNYYKRGFLYLEEKLYKEAIADLDKALEMSCKPLTPFHISGQSHTPKDLEMLALVIQDVVDKNPDFGEAYCLLGLIGILIHRAQPGCRLILQGESLTNKPYIFKNGDCNAAGIHAKLGAMNYDNQKYEIALGHLNEAIRLDPFFAKAIDLRGDIKLKLNDYAGARNDWYDSEKLGHSGGIEKSKKFLPEEYAISLAELLAPWDIKRYSKK